MTDKSQTTKKQEDWMNRKWRPAMAWLYLVVCVFDFIIFPVAWAIFLAYTQQTIAPWNPLTIQGAGLFHLAMGAVLGISAWSRGQEKLSSVHRTYDENEDLYYNDYKNNNNNLSSRNYRRVPRQSMDEEL